MASKMRKSLTFLLFPFLIYESFGAESVGCGNLEVAKKYLNGETLPKPIVRIFMNNGKKEKKIYYCSGYVQKFFLLNFGKEWCVEHGLMKEGGLMGGTWNIIKSVEERGFLFFKSKDGENELKKRYRKAKLYGNKKKIEELKKKFLEIRKKKKGLEEILQPLDVLGMWYPDSLYNKYDYTHLCVYLGKKNGKKYVLQQWGEKAEIVSLENLYEKVPLGIEVIIRFFK